MDYVLDRSVILFGFFEITRHRRSEDRRFVCCILFSTICGCAIRVSLSLLQIFPVLVLVVYICLAPVDHKILCAFSVGLLQD